MARADIRIRIRGRIVRVHVSEPVIRTVIRVTANIRTALRNLVLYFKELGASGGTEPALPMLFKSESPATSCSQRNTPRQ